jgi:hypothetical protein
VIANTLEPNSRWEKYIPFNEPLSSLPRQTFGTEGSAHALSKRKDATFLDIAKAYVSERTGLEETEFEAESILEGDFTNTVWFVQKLARYVPLDNSRA